MGPAEVRFPDSRMAPISSGLILPSAAYTTVPAIARAMAGTVVYAAEGKIKPEEIGAILDSGNRTAAGPTVPPGGLYMTKLWYDDGIEKFEVGSDWTE